MNATVGGWPSGRIACFHPMIFPRVLNAKQGDSIGHLNSMVWLDRVSNPNLIFLVGYVKERLWWPIQSPKIGIKKKANS